MSQTTGVNQSAAVDQQAPGLPGAFPRPPGNAFARPGAGQRVRRLLALLGQPGLRHAARQLGIRHAILTSQVSQLEDAAGTMLLRTGPDGTITLTLDGEQFARDVGPGARHAGCR